MKAHRSSLVVLLMIVPLLGWVLSAPVAPMACPRASRSEGAPVTSPMTCDMTHCAMGCSMHHRRCGVSSLPQLTLPAPLMPVVQMPAAASGVPNFHLLTITQRRSDARARSGWRGPLLQPPRT